MHKRKLFVLALLITVITTVVLLSQNCTTQSHKNQSSADIWNNNEYIGDTKCKSCHQKEYDDWKMSDHYRSMLPANDSTVLGDFNKTVFSADGVSNKFFKKEGKFFINTQGQDGDSHDFEVLYTFGYKPLQQYLIKVPNGKMQATRVSWDTEKKKWVHQYAGQKIAHYDWLHWTGGAQNWNTMCAYCHSTNLQKNYHAEKDSFHTTYSAVNVSCETCHGPAKKHIDYIESSAYKTGKRIEGSLIFTTAGNSKAQVDMCAPCHARTSTITGQLIHSRELLDDFIPEIPSTRFFFADGQINDEDYNYTSFLQSVMYHRGVQCSNCHNPHSGKIIYPGNQLCRQCHTANYDSPSHTFHATGTEGASCTSCHMPGKYYMGNDYRHDHSFRVPRPDISVQYNIPNACNNCHKDKSYQWASTVVKKWYGDKRKYHFADDLVPGSLLDEKSESHLTKLIEDTSVPAIVKATAAFYLQDIATPTSLQILLKCLHYPNAQVRYRALQSLQHFQPDKWISVAGHCLSDSIRAVRIAAADLYTSIPEIQFPKIYKTPFLRAKEELLAHLNFQLDFSTGSLNMANYRSRVNEKSLAEKYYTRALKQDSLLNVARIQLSSMYNAQHRNNDALELLQQAVQIDPNNAHAFYFLALLQTEMGNNTDAIQNFDKAIALKTRDPKVFYNYGLFLRQQGKIGKAEAVLQKGIMMNSNNTALLYALTYLYIQENNLSKAKETAIQLKQIAPYNSEYTEIYEMLGL